MKKKYLHARYSLLVCFLSFGLFASCVNTRETLRSGWVLGEQQRSACSIDLPHIGQSMRSRHIKKFPTVMFAGLTIFTAFVGLAYWGNIGVDHTIIEPYRNGSISPMI